MANKFWEFKNFIGDAAELLLYGPIRSEVPWYMDPEQCPTYMDFIQELQALGLKSAITVRINSPGGDIFAAYAISNHLRDNPARIITKNDGLVASAALNIFALGDERLTPVNGIFVFHKPLAGLCGNYNSEDLDQINVWLNTVEEGMTAALRQKTGKTVKELSKMMAGGGTMMTGQKAIDNGFADKLIGDDSVNPQAVENFLIVNKVAHDLSIFNETRGLVLGIQNAIRGEVIPPVVDSKVEKGGNEDLDLKTIDELKQAFPELVAQIIVLAKSEGMTEEQTRIKDILDISTSIDPVVLNKALFVEPVDSRELAFQALKADAANGKKALLDVEADLIASGAGKIKGTPNQQELDQQAAKTEVTVSAIVAGADKKRR